MDTDNNAKRVPKEDLEQNEKNKEDIKRIKVSVQEEETNYDKIVDLDEFNNAKRIKMEKTEEQNAEHYVEKNDSNCPNAIRMEQDLQENKVNLNELNKDNNAKNVKMEKTEEQNDCQNTMEKKDSNYLNDIKMEDIDLSSNNNTLNRSMDSTSSNSRREFAIGLKNHAKMLVQKLAKWQEVSVDNADKAARKKLDKSLYTDLIVHCSDQRSFAVHAIVLMAGSQRLKELLIPLRAKKCNNRHRELTLTDVEGEELTWMLRYLYNGKTSLESQLQKDRMTQLVQQYGLITSDQHDGNINQGTEDMSFFEEVRKGGVMRTARGAKCLECGKDFVYFQSAQQHFEVKHTKPDPSKFTCHLCGKENTHIFYLKRHLRKVHNIRKKDFLGKRKS